MKKNVNIRTNVQFLVTKKVTNANGFLLPHILFDRIKTVATYPIKEFYFQDIPELTGYRFKMYKNALVNDKLTIQAQLVNKDENDIKVNIVVTKRKKASKTEEPICSALFGFPIKEQPFQNNKEAC